MQLSSFKQLILRKVNDENLRSQLINFDQNAFDNLVVESLIKMALKRSKGHKANQSVVSMGSHLDPHEESREISMLRDALGHHASRYKKALELDDKPMVDLHARNFFKLLDFAHTLSPHSNGLLNVDSVPLQPWERNIPGKNITFAEKMEQDPKYAEKVKTWHLRPEGKGKVHDALKSPDRFAIVDSGFDIWRDHPHKGDWDFLNKDPHDRLKYEAATQGHLGSYPMEHTKINGKFIPIEDVENVRDEKSMHPFDHHPIFSKTKDGKVAFKVSFENRNPQDDADFSSHVVNYNKSQHVSDFKNKLRELSQKPDYESLGSKIGASVHGEKNRYQDPKTINFKEQFPTRGRVQKPQQQNEVPEHVKKLFEKPSSETVAQPETDQKGAKINPDFIPSHLRHLIKD